MAFFQLPVCTMWPNHEVVVFQTRTGTTPDPVSVSIITNFILASSRPTCFNRFLDLYMFPSSILTPPSVTIIHRITSIVSPFLILLYRRKKLFTWTSHTPAPRQPPPLVSAPRAACLRLLPSHESILSPLFRPWTAPRYLSSHGG